jgi:hypothetical protein
MYATVPFVAAVLALIFYLLLRGGLVSTRTSSDDISPYGMAAFAALVGLFSRQTAAKLKVVFETLLAPGEKGADHTGPASDTGQPSGQPSGPRITVVEPAGARAGDTVAIRGTGLAAASAVRIGSIDVPQFTVVSDRELSIVVPSGTQTANVTVVTPAGSAVSRHPLEVLPTTP